MEEKISEKVKDKTKIWRNMTENKKKGNSVKRIKWQPNRIYLVPKQIIVDEKERLFNELSEIIFEMNQIFNLKPLEVYEKE
jgi:hypothetical protein